MRCKVDGSIEMAAGKLIADENCPIASSDVWLETYGDQFVGPTLGTKPTLARRRLVPCLIERDDFS